VHKVRTLLRANTSAKCAPKDTFVLKSLSLQYSVRVVNMQPQALTNVKNVQQVIFAK
jgi:hypothetical protein